MICREPRIMICALREGHQRSGPSNPESIGSPRRVCQLKGSVAPSVVAECAYVSRSVMIDAIELVGAVFSGLSVLVIEDVEDAGEVIRVRARSAGGPVACPWLRLPGGYYAKPGLITARADPPDMRGYGIVAKVLYSRTRMDVRRAERGCAWTGQPSRSAGVSSRLYSIVIVLVLGLGPVLAGTGQMESAGGEPAIWAAMRSAGVRRDRLLGKQRGPDGPAHAHSR
jgi:hypothetical protein